MPPAPRRSAGPARPHRLRSARHASAGRGGAGRDCPGAPPGGLGVRNARDTPCPKPAARALPPASPQGQLNLTACDRRRPRRVGWAVRGGTGLSRRAIARGGGPPPRALTSCPGCTCASSCGATHGTVARACWCRRAAGATPSVRGARCSSRRGRCVAHCRWDGTPPPGAGAPEARPRAVGIFARGNKTSMERSAARRRKRRAGGSLNLLGLSPG